MRQDQKELLKAILVSTSFTGGTSLVVCKHNTKIKQIVKYLEKLTNIKAIIYDQYGITYYYVSYGKRGGIYVMEHPDYFEWLKLAGHLNKISI